MINKLTIDKGAVFDYEDIVAHMPLNKAKMRTVAEKMLDKCDGDELRLPYKDEDSQLDLLLFIKKGYLFGIMQMWILRGICEAKDYSKELEDRGLIKEWLEVIIE